MSIIAARNGINVTSDANNVKVTEVDCDGKEAAIITFDRRDAKMVAKAITEAAKTKPKTE